MRLTKWRRRILTGYAAIVFLLCFLAVPWVIILKGNRITPPYRVGPIFSPPRKATVLATIDIPVLAVELLGVTAVAGVAFALAGPKEEK